MAGDLNHCSFIGRLGKDVETRYMPNGDAVASFSLAVGSRWKDKKSGEKKESTEWVNCSVFGVLAQVCGDYLKKGSQVFVSGRLKTDKYTDKQGVERYTTKVVVDQMQILGGKPSGEPQEKKFEGGAATSSKKYSGDIDSMDDDIPFIFNALHSDSTAISKAFLRARRAR